MPVATNPRPGRLWRTFLDLQTARYTPVSNFTPSPKFWSSHALADPVRARENPEWYLSFHNADFVDAEYQFRDLGEGSFSTYMTPTFMQFALQNCFGPYSAPNFSLVGYINAYVTLGFIEDKSLVNQALRFIRMQDTLFHKMTLRVDGTGYCIALTEYSSEFQDTFPISGLAGAGITLPPPPMDQDDLNVFPGRTVTVFKNPGSTNLQIPFEHLEIVLDWQPEDGGQTWDMFQRRTQARRRSLKAHLYLTGKPGDEYWQLGLDAGTNTKSTYQITFAAGGHTFQVTMNNMAFKLQPFGPEKIVYEPMVAVGLAAQDTVNPAVQITLT